MQASYPQFRLLRRLRQVDWRSRLAETTEQDPCQDSNAIGWASELAQPQNACLLLHRLWILSLYMKKEEKNVIKFSLQVCLILV